MLEIDSEETPDQQNPLCSSTTEVTENKNLENDEESNYELFEAAYRAILDELIDDAKWELCFEVHRAVKLGYFFLDDPPEKRSYQVVEEGEKDIFGQRLKCNVQNYQISCPICKNKSCATKFASHLAKCIGISGRYSSRAASKKIAAAVVYGSDLEESDYDSDPSFNINKKRSKNSQAKKSSRRKAKVQGHSFPKSSETNYNYQEMTYEQRKAFLDQKCGVISKRRNKMCMNPHKCVQHTDEQRRDVRLILLCNMGDQLTSDAQLDVDTVDVGNDDLSFMAQAVSACSTANKNTPSGTGGAISEVKRQPSSKSHAANLKKKKTDFDTSDSSSSSIEVLPSVSSYENI